MLDLLPLALANAAIAAATVVQLAVGLGFAMVAAPLLLLIDPRLMPGPFLVAGVRPPASSSRSARRRSRRG